MWYEVHRKPGTSFQQSSPNRVTENMSPNKKLWQKVWNVAKQGSSLETTPMVFIGGWHPFAWHIPKFHSEPLLSVRVIGMLPTALPLKSKFPDFRQELTLQAGPSKESSVGPAMLISVCKNSNVLCFHFHSVQNTLFSPLNSSWICGLFILKIIEDISRGLFCY